MKLKIIAYLFFLIGIIDFGYKILYGSFLDPDGDYYEYVRSLIIFTPVVSKESNKLMNKSIIPMEKPSK